jgi:hypothetical protein
MPARTFEDSTGAVWEVFEVHRSATHPGSVSGGLEQGWLAFMSGERKRRLAPFPPEWQTAPEPELERLCSVARAVSPTRYPFDPSTRDRRGKEREAAGPADTGERRRADDSTAAALGAAHLEMPNATVGSGEEGVEMTVREFAHQARARRLPAIDAMVQLKALLHEKFAEPDSAARDLRLVRRWFVEAYYFERRG